MDAANSFSSKLLEVSAAAYAGVASSLLLELHPDIGERYAPSAMAEWKSQLTQRVFELSAALEAQEPTIFTSRVHWASKAFRARDLEIDDLKRSLVCLRQVLDEQLPKMARDTARQYLDAALQGFDGIVAPSDTIFLDPESPTDKLALQYLQLALEGQAPQAVSLIVDAVHDGLDLMDAYVGILVAAQREVGALWHLGELNIAEEHLVTTTTERAMAVLAQTAPRRPNVGKTVVASAVAGNEHGLGVRVLSDVFERAGWRSICLGANVPGDDMTSSAVFFNADLVLLSVTLSTQIKAAKESIEALRRVPDLDLKILVGGQALRETPDLWKRLGADGQADDIKSVVAMGHRLVGLEPPPASI